MRVGAQKPATATQFHEQLPGYVATPLLDVPLLAARLGVAEVVVKDERRRLGTASFKILGASWAAYQAIDARAGGLGPWTSLDDLRAHIRALGPLTLVTGTAGNHGRAVARTAALLGVAGRIFAPDDIARDRRQAIARDGAELHTGPWTYDDAVAFARDAADDDCLLVSDAGVFDDDAARRTIEGYETIGKEICAQQPADRALLVAIQIGVGGLAAAMIRQLGGPCVRVVGVEPSTAACVSSSLRSGQPVSLDVDGDCGLPGLNCGRPSAAAWPLLADGLDDCVAIDANDVAEAVSAFAEAGIDATPTAAAGLAGILGHAELRPDPHSRLLVVLTEGRESG